ncbi:DUF975 family protein [Fructobacillus papyrifericola]|uniref:DUF975 family protein n=1 Tax=Fructobacillus papyrifericola TaxID=2713172 RepID=A0ABS5QR71_9LACO|nr:DUF975 family protein [Fructobacillus papyrifericola]MBS9335693.1 DUF975 family protein [Fructobacillus papyrifericola]
MTEFVAISRRRVKLTAKKQLKEQYKNSLKATWPLIISQVLKSVLFWGSVYLLLSGYVLAPKDASANWYLSKTFFGALFLLLTWSAKWAIVDFFQKPTVKRGYAVALQGFAPKRFGEAFLLAFVQKIQLFFWSFLFFPAIVKVFSYSQTYYAYKMDLLFDRKQGSLTDYVTISRRVMTGRKRELFLLELSFIGWRLLSLLTLGLADFFVTPYLNTCRVVYSTQVFAQAIEGVRS